MIADQNKVRILFVCTGNACRSQMAEAWALTLKSDQIDVYSAGTHPAGTLSSRVVQVMSEAGVDMSEHWSKPIDFWVDVTFDYVITLCDHAKQYCPEFAHSTQMIHKHIPDPMGIIGVDKQTMDVFRRTRDFIKAYVASLPECLARSPV
jgi:arsenate reductase (thioredoxin)